MSKPNPQTHTPFGQPPQTNPQTSNSFGSPLQPGQNYQISGCDLPRLVKQLQELLPQQQPATELPEWFYEKDIIRFCMCQFLFVKFLEIAYPKTELLHFFFVRFTPLTTVLDANLTYIAVQPNFKTN